VRLAAPAPRQEQRKVVTVLFCDVAGSTALGERLDPEALRTVMGAYFDVARAAIERHGGMVEKFIGDAVMAVFGVPTVREDDAVRAVRAAQELRDAVEIDVRIGVNTGEVVTGGGGEKLVTGDAVNVAARLEQAADTGEVLLGDETYRLVRDAVTVETLEPIPVKGKTEPLTVHRLVAVDAAAPGLARHLDAPMVGREHERRLLEDAFGSAARRRACALFTLLGTAGVGKSRLTREFLASVDARVVQGRCLSYGDGITYWPVVEVVKALGGTEAAPPEAAETIAALLGESDGTTTAEGIAWAVRKLLEDTAEERPLVVLFDDIHWGEPTFLDLVEHVADLSRDAPILLLCLARPELLERRPGWGGGKLNATTTLLEPLDAAETDELIERLLGDEELDPALEQRIRTASEGNPLYVEEMVAMVRESGERDVVVPPSIKALLAARLDQLDPAERVVLERGSVEGQLFHSAAVQALSTPPEPVDRQLVGLVRKELVRPDRPQLPVGDAYRFRHLLIRDAAYDALPKATRAELHERFAVWLEERGPGLVEHDEILGYHFEQAHRYRSELGTADESTGRRAADLLTNAARNARLRGDTTASARLFQRAADLAGPGRPALLPELAEMLFETGRIAEAAAVLDEALEASRELGDERLEAMADVWRLTLSGHLGEPGFSMDGMIRRAGEAAALLERLGDDRALATMLQLEGRHLFFVGRAREAAGVLERGKELALASGDVYGARICATWTISALGWGPAPLSELRSYLDRIPAEIARVLAHDPILEFAEARIAGYSGRFEEARESHARGLAICNEVGWLIPQYGAVGHLGLIEFSAGDFAAAESVLREGFDALGELGEVGYRSSVGSLLAQALVRLGRAAEALELLEIVEPLAAPDDCDPQVRTRLVRALALAQLGEPERGVPIARQAVALAARTDYTMLHADALMALAEVWHVAGDVEQGRIALREALALFRQKEAVVLAEQAEELLARG
jgi:class 3 adenylate cyclase/tetratricopeptide (TPR) repeat protein